MQQALKNDNSVAIRKRYADALLMAKQYDAAIEHTTSASSRIPAITRRCRTRASR